jgi:hypothetical protein
MNTKEAIKLLKKSHVGRIGLSYGDNPYIVPLNFIYYDFKIYFHCTIDGKKLEYIKRNPKICFEVDNFIGIKKGDTPCLYSSYYRSVIVFGEATVVKTTEKKRQVLKKLIAKYAKQEVTVFDDEKLKNVEVVELIIKNITGKEKLPK